MRVFDMHHSVTPETGFDLAIIATDTTSLGNIIDTATYESLEFLLISGTIADGAYAVSLQEGDDSGLSDVAAVSADETLGDADFALTDDDTSKKIGYIGKKRYVRLSIVSTATTSGGTLGAIALLGTAQTQPTAD